MMEIVVPSRTSSKLNVLYHIYSFREIQKIIVHATNWPYRLKGLRLRKRTHVLSSETNQLGKTLTSVLFKC